MKPYEEIDFPNGFLRWIREDGMYSCTLTEEQMAKIKAIHEAPRTWVGLTYEDMTKLQKDLYDAKGESVLPTTFAMAVEAKLKEKNT